MRTLPSTGDHSADATGRGSLSQENTRDSCYSYWLFTFSTTYFQIAIVLGKTTKVVRTDNNLVRIQGDQLETGRSEQSADVCWSNQWRHVITHAPQTLHLVIRSFFLTALEYNSYWVLQSKPTQFKVELKRCYYSVSPSFLFALTHSRGGVPTFLN